MILSFAKGNMEAVIHVVMLSDDNVTCSGKLWT